MRAALTRRRLLPYLLILPALVLIVVFKLFPIVSTLRESVMVDGGATASVYQSLAHDPTFWNSLWVTIKFNLVITPLQILLAFVLAMVVNSTVKGIGAFRTVIYLPITISLTVATILWNMMLSPNNGIVNSVLGIFGIAPQGFFTDKNQALWSIVLIASWKGVPYWTMFILAGLKNIDRSIYESVKIDGAGWWTTVTRVTIPLIRRVLLFVFVANTTANVLQFVPMQMITQGGPEQSTNVLMFEAYKSAFKFVDRPRSAAIVTVMLVIIAVVCVLQFRFFSDRDDKAANVR